MKKTNIMFSSSEDAIEMKASLLGIPLTLSIVYHILSPRPCNQKVYFARKIKQNSTDIMGFLTSIMPGTQCVESSKHLVIPSGVNVIKHIKMFADSSQHMISI